MANDANLQIRISADSKDLQKEIAKARGQLDKFEKSAKKTGNTVGKAGKQIGANATPAVLEFNRAIQDAPFGIQGVANNIQQLTANFGQLKKQTGSTKSALLALGKGLVSGPLAVLTAVSIVTALLVKFGDKLGTTKKEVKSLDEQLQDYVKTLKGVESAQLKGSQSAAKELTNLRLLKGQVENTNLSLEDRNRAYNELQRLYPSYFGNLEREDALAGDLSKVYNNLTDAILKRARAQAAADIITENTKKQLILQKQLAEQEDKTNQARLLAANAIVARQGVLNVQTGFNTKQYDEQARLSGEVLKNIREEERIGGEINKLQNDSLNLAKLISDEGGILPIKFTSTVGDDALPKFNLAEALQGPLTEQAEQLNSLLSKRFREIGVQLGSYLLPTLSPDSVTKNEKLWNDAADRIAARAKSRAQQIAILLETSLEQGAFDFGAKVGEAFASGGNILNAAGSALLETIGNISVRLGKMIIAQGVAIEAAKKAMTTLQGVGAIVAGTALVAIGSAFKSKAAALARSGGSSGDSYTSGSTRESYSGSAANFGSSGFSGGSRVVFEIAGTKLVGVISNTLRRDAALGGSLKLTN